jgi:hypothetical protein
MSWDNYGKEWQIDHILPLSLFDLKDEKHIKIAVHWTNLQPLKSSENTVKYNHLHLHYYFNNIVNVFRFNAKYKQFLGHQAICESRSWLREKLKYGKSAPYEDTDAAEEDVYEDITDEEANVSEMDNPQPSP